MNDLKEKLKELDLTQRELAEFMEVDQGYISRLLAEDVVPVEKVRVRILTAAREAYEAKKARTDAAHESLVQVLQGG